MKAFTNRWSSIYRDKARAWREGDRKPKPQVNAADPFVCERCGYRTEDPLKAWYHDGHCTAPVQGLGVTP